RRTATAKCRPREDPMGASLFEDIHCRPGRFRKKIVVEGVRPKHDRSGVRISRLPSFEPGTESLGSKSGNPALLRHAGHELGNILQERKVRGEVYQAGSRGGQASPDIDMGKSISAARTETPFVVVGEKFSLVGSQIHTHRTIALAAFAGKAQVQRLLHLLVLPAIPDHIALNHLPKKMGTTPGRVFLLAGHAKAGTHDTAAFVATAFPDSHAAQGGVRQAALVLGKLKMSFRLPWPVTRAQPKVLVQAIG